MVDIRTIKKLIELVKSSGVGEIEVQSGEDSVRISLQSSAAPASAMMTVAPPAVSAPAAVAVAEPVIKDEPVVVDEGHTLASPMVGTVYLASSPGAKPIVEVGQHVSVGDTVCLVEAMKMFNAIEADCSGIIRARLIENGQAIEFGQSLFLIDPDN